MLLRARPQAPQYFPLYAFLSALAFFNTQDLVDENHLLYLLVPFSIYGVIAGGESFEAATKFKLLTFFIIMTGKYKLEATVIKQPLVIFSIWYFKQYYQGDFDQALDQYLLTGLLYDITNIAFLNTFWWWWYLIVGVYSFLGYGYLVRLLLREFSVVKED